MIFNMLGEKLRNQARFVIIVFDTAVEKVLTSGLGLKSYWPTKEEIQSKGVKSGKRARESCKTVSWTFSLLHPLKYPLPIYYKKNQIYKI